VLFLLSFFRFSLPRALSLPRSLVFLLFSIFLTAAAAALASIKPKRAKETTTTTTDDDVVAPKTGVNLNIVPASAAKV
jgi:hypothetical protein